MSSIVSNIKTTLAPAQRFLTGQGVATGTAQIITSGGNYTNLKRGVLVRNLSFQRLFVGAEDVTESTGFIIPRHSDHLFPVESSGRLYIIGEPVVITNPAWVEDPEEPQTIETYELNEFTWWAM